MAIDDQREGEPYVLTGIGEQEQSIGAANLGQSVDSYMSGIEHGDSDLAEYEHDSYPDFESSSSMGTSDGCDVGDSVPADVDADRGYFGASVRNDGFFDDTGGVCLGESDESDVRPVCGFFLLSHTLAGLSTRSVIGRVR